MENLEHWIIWFYPFRDVISAEYGTSGLPEFYSRMLLTELYSQIQRQICFEGWSEHWKADLWLTSIKWNKRNRGHVLITCLHIRLKIYLQEVQKNGKDRLSLLDVCNVLKMVDAGTDLCGNCQATTQCLFQVHLAKSFVEILWPIPPNAASPWVAYLNARESFLTSSKKKLSLSWT